MKVPILADERRAPSAIDRYRNILSVLTAKERKVIVSLRLTMPAAETSAKPMRHLLQADDLQICRMFSDIATSAAANGLRICSPSSLFISEDELAFISILSELQRPSLCGHWDLSHPFMACLQHCADLLETRIGRLPARATLAATFRDRFGCLQIRERGLEDAVAITDIGRHHSHAPVRGNLASILKARVLDAVKGEPVIRTSQFNALGISRQYVGTLYKSGYLERISHGHYRLSRRFTMEAET